MKYLKLLLLLITLQSNSQSDDGIYKLNIMDSLLTSEVKQNLSERIINKRIIFLGESQHNIGSDFLAKSQFVKYLVVAHGFKDIAFEGDFFALYNEHDSKNLFPMWSKSVQCQDLFAFLKEHNVTIWGFDNQFSSRFSFTNFTKMLFNFLDEHEIAYDPIFKVQVEEAVLSGPEIKRKLKTDEISQLLDSIDELLRNSEIKKNHFWNQALQNFITNIRQNMSNEKSGIEIRDKQMASNLDFLTSEHKGKKFLVWAANGHISKLDVPSLNNQTMGYQYSQNNPDVTYHIAFSSIFMPYRTDKWIEKQRKNPRNLLFLLPSIYENYYIDSETILQNNIDLRNKKFEGMFGRLFENIEYFQHFDALVFIAKGEKNIHLN